MSANNALIELIAEMISKEEDAAAARDLVTEYMQEHKIKQQEAAGHVVTFVSSGFRTAHADAMKDDPAYISAKAAYDAARKLYEYKASRDAYIRVNPLKAC